MSDMALYMAEIWRWTKMCQPWLDNTSGTFIIGIPCVKFYKSDGDRTLPRGPDRLVKSLSRYIHALVSFSQSTQTPTSITSVMSESDNTASMNLPSVFYPRVLMMPHAGELGARIFKCVKWHFTN